MSVLSTHFDFFIPLICFENESEKAFKSKRKKAKVVN